MEALSPRLQQVIESLTDNEALTDNLDDQAAQALLDWGIAFSKPIVQSTASLPEAAAADAMQPRLQATRCLLRAVNNYFTPANAPATGAATSRSVQKGSAANLPLLSEVMEQASLILGPSFNKPDEEQLAAFATQLSNEASTAQGLIDALRNFVDQQQQAAPVPNRPAEVGTVTDQAVAPQPVVAHTAWMRRLLAQLRRFYQEPKQMD